MADKGNPDQESRNSRGRYVRGPAAQERARQAIELRSDGLTYQQIADELDYADKKSAWNAIWRQLRREARAPAEAMIQGETERLLLELERLDTEEERLDALVAPVMRVLESEHVTVSNGRVVELNGQPIPDDAPVLQAVDRLTRLSAERRAISDQRRRHSESLRKLLGLDAAQKVDVSGGLRYEVVGIDPDDLT